MPVQTILDGKRNVVVKIDDVATGTGTAIDVSALVPACTRVNIDEIWFSVAADDLVKLIWDATADVDIISLHGQQDFCFDKFGGLTNNAGAGVTGDVLYDGGASAGDFTIVIHATKHGIIDPEL